MGPFAIRGAAGRHLILRTSWVVSSHDANFVKTMRSLGLEPESLNVVPDQIGGPTPAGDIADALLVAARVLVGGAKGSPARIVTGMKLWEQRSRAARQTSDLVGSSHPRWQGGAGAGLIHVRRDRNQFVLESMGRVWFQDVIGSP